MKRENYVVIFGAIIIATILLVRYVDSRIYKLENEMYKGQTEIYEAITRNTEMISVKQRIIK